jgi:hypothetical protein
VPREVQLGIRHSVNSEITVEHLIEFIRHHQRIAKEMVIDQYTLLEKDLGITGDDGGELLDVIEKEFAVSFVGSDSTIRKAFGLEKSEYLFHNEGVGFFEFIASFLGRGLEKVKPLTVGELYKVVLSAQTARPAAS